MKHNWTILVLLVVAGVVFGLYGIPWLQGMGRTWVAFIVYGVLVLAFLYTRHTGHPLHGARFRRRARRSPDQL